MPATALSRFRTKTASVLYDCRHFLSLSLLGRNRFYECSSENCRSKNYPLGQLLIRKGGTSRSLPFVHIKN